MDELRTEADSGWVVGIEDGLARVLVGAEAAEWWFPLTMLPPATRIGDGVQLVRSGGGRYEVLGFSRTTPGAFDRSIEDRLARPLARRRTPA